MEIKKRLFYLDFIRVFAIIVIILTHYNALFIYNVYRPNLAIGSTNIFNIYIGSFGVSLFLIISGASLMYVYQKKNIKLSEFYIKRIKRIYPMFWVAYFTIFCFSVINGGDAFLNRTMAPKFNFIYSLLGIDGYLSVLGVKTFYIVGEWFLGFIIIFYLFFPFMLKSINKFPKITLIITILIYIFSIYYFGTLSISDCILPIRLLEIVFGMYFVKYNITVKWYTALCCLLVLVFNQLFQLPFNINIRVTYIGICTFTLLVYISSFLQKNNIITNLCNLICKYSYPCFIIHHWAIGEVFQRINLNEISKSSSYMLFICSLIAIIISTYILQKLTDKVTKTINDILKT